VNFIDEDPPRTTHPPSQPEFPAEHFCDEASAMLRGDRIPSPDLKEFKAIALLVDR
jgi:hypothetical protein